MLGRPRRLPCECYHIGIPQKRSDCHHTGVSTVSGLRPKIVTPGKLQRYQLSRLLTAFPRRNRGWGVHHFAYVTPRSFLPSPSPTSYCQPLLHSNFTIMLNPNDLLSYSSNLSKNKKSQQGLRSGLLPLICRALPLPYVANGREPYQELLLRTCRNN